MIVMLIEQYGRQQAVKLPTIEEGPIVVGRSWQCDVVVVDPYVDAEHLKISANDDDHFSIEDLHSENGTRVSKKSIDGQTRYELGDDIVLGETTIRLLDGNNAVSDAVRYEPVLRLAQKFNNSMSAVLAALVAACMLLAVVYGGDDKYVDKAGLIDGALTAGLFLFCWCFVGSILSLLGRGKSLFYLHCVFLCALFSAAVAARLISIFIDFNIGSIAWQQWSGLFLGTVSSAALTYGVITLITKLGRRKKVIFTALTAATFVFLEVVQPKLAPPHEQWTERAVVRHVGQPPELFFGNTVSLDSHLEKTGTLFDRLDANLGQTLSD